MTMATDSELEGFKSTISVVDVAINSFGPELDARDSSRSLMVLRAEGNKLFRSKHNTPGHDVYFGRDAPDKGKVVDLRLPPSGQQQPTDPGEAPIALIPASCEATVCQADLAGSDQSVGACGLRNSLEASKRTAAS